MRLKFKNEDNDNLVILETLDSQTYRINYFENNSNVGTYLDIEQFMFDELTEDMNENDIHYFCSNYISN
jgi:hypothetical protein